MDAVAAFFLVTTSSFSANCQYTALETLSVPRLIPNIENRVRKLPKPANYSQALQPLFEAVSNALYAIEDRVLLGMTEQGKVRIDITRSC